MHPLVHFLQALFNQPGHSQSHTQIPFSQRPASQGGPDFTYNPNPHTNIPFSSHDPQLVLNMHQIFQPAQVRALSQIHSQRSNFSTPLQGRQNLGLIPFQGSMGVINGGQNAYSSPQSAIDIMNNAYRYLQ